MGLGARVGSRVGSKVGARIGNKDKQPNVVVLIWGQSWCLYEADIDSLTQKFGYDIPFTRAKMMMREAAAPNDPLVWTLTALSSVAPGTHPTSNMGIHLSLVRRLDDVYPGRVRVAVMAIGGSGMHDNWRAGVAYPTLLPRLSTQLITEIQNVRNAIGKPRWGVPLRGQTDALDSTDAGAYQVDQLAEIAAVRAVLPDILLAIPTVSDSHPYAEKATVKAAITAVVAATTHCLEVNTDGIPLNGINHPTANGFDTVGELIAEALLVLDDQPRVRWLSTSVGRTITFDYTGTGGTAVAWSWNFGDGQTSTLENPSHAYAANGNYTVTCTATSASGKKHKRSETRVAVDPTGLWTKDATSLRGRPITLTEEALLVAAGQLQSGAANHCWPCQESSPASLVDVFGNPTVRSLAPSNTPGYQQSETGHATKFVGPSGDNITESFVSAVMANAVSGRVMQLASLRWEIATTVANQPIFNRGAVGIVQLTSSGTSAKFRAALGATALVSQRDHAGLVLPYLMYHDAIDHVFWVATTLEFIEGLWVSTAGGATELITCSTLNDATAGRKFNYVKAWNNVPQRLYKKDAREILQAHNYDVEWTD